MSIIYKYLEKQIKDLNEEKGIVQFYANAFGNKDSDGDIIEKGAFAKSIQEQGARIKHLLNHRVSIGVPIEIKEDSFGLLTTSQMILGKQAGREAFEEYKVYASLNKSMEHSIGLIPTKHYQDKARGAKIIKEAILRDVTTMETWGANSNTPQISVKSDSSIIENIEILEEMLKGRFNDERLKDIENKLIELKSLIDEPQESTRKTNEPINNKYLVTFYNYLKI